MLCCSGNYIHRHTGLTRTYSGVIVSCKDTAGELNCDGCVCVCVEGVICVCVCDVHVKACGVCVCSVLCAQGRRDR